MTELRSASCAYGSSKEGFMVTSSNPRTVSSSWVIELILECVAIRDPEFTLVATELQYISYMEIYH